ncbi:hypothetical protein F5146DRAFT_622578 [Armillaria mellea]|nr:hypothetical protein F5146DRAFT_622578 [Armillaria mellea]
MSTSTSTSCVCSICLSDFVDPVCTPCGHVYCSRCITEATSTQRNEGSATAPCPTCRKLFSINDDPRFWDFREYFGYPLRRLYVNGLHVNFEDKVKKLENRIATLERENQRLRRKRNALLSPRHLSQQEEMNSWSVPWLVRTPWTRSWLPPWTLQEGCNLTRTRRLAKGFIFGLVVLVGSIAGLTLYDAFAVNTLVRYWIF